MDTSVGLRRLRSKVIARDAELARDFNAYAWQRCGILGTASALSPAPAAIGGICLFLWVVGLCLRFDKQQANRKQALRASEYWAEGSDKLMLWKIAPTLLLVLPLAMRAVQIWPF